MSLQAQQQSARRSPYYAAYQNGFRAGEVDAELGSCEGSHFDSPPEGVNPDAYHEAQMWGYNDGREANSESRSAWSILAYLDNEYCI